MVKLAEYPRTATFAWSYGKDPVLATGTASGTVDAEFSSASTLEFWSVLSQECKEPDGKIVADAKFNDLDWNRDGCILAGALENGIVEFFNSKEKQSIAKISKHSSGVKTLRFNAKQDNVLVSGGNHGEIFVWDCNKIGGQGYSPFGPGTAMTPIEEVQSLAWNQTLAHVFASADSSGFASIWDLKAKKEVIHLSYTSPTTGLRNPVSVVEWHPSNSTKIATATGNDNEPMILVWDLRNANIPLKVLSQGHSKGILSLDWCQQDETLMISSGRDNTCILWNPEESQKLTQFPTRGNWCFKTKFAPCNPDIFASASFDNKVQVQTLQNLENTLDLDQSAYKKQESETEFWNNVSQNESNEKATVTKLQAPNWYKNASPTARWAFGGKLVSIDQASKQVLINKPELEGFEKNSMLEEALNNKNFVPIINKRLANTIDSNNEEDWTLLESLSMDGKATYLKESLALDDEDDTENNKDGTSDDGQQFFDKLDQEFVPEGPFQLDVSSQPLTTSLLKADFKKAINITLENELLLESFIIALNSNDQALKDKVQGAYFAKYGSKSPLARILYSISIGKVNDLVDNVDVSNWKHAVAAINTYSSGDEKNALLIKLGDRMLESGDRQNALVLYLAGHSLNKVASTWLKEFPSSENKLRSKMNTMNEAHLACLTEFVERFTVLSNYVNDGKDTKLTNEGLIAKFLEFVNITASSGDFDLALKFLDHLPGDNQQVKTEKQRVLIASGKSVNASGNSATANRKQKFIPPTSNIPMNMPMGLAPNLAQGKTRVPPPYNGTTTNAFASTYQSTVTGHSQFASAPTSHVAPTKYAPAVSTTPIPPVAVHAAAPAPSNPYAPSSSNYGSYAPQGVNTTSIVSPPPPPIASAAVPHAGANMFENRSYSQSSQVGPTDPNLRVLSGQAPHLNKDANNGWNDLPEIVPEKKTRAKAVSTAPINNPSNSGMQTPGSGYASNIPIPPPPPLTKATSSASMSGSQLPPPPQKVSRRSSVAQTPAVNGASTNSNPYAPSMSQRNSLSPSANPYAPNSSSTMAAPSPYAPQMPLTTVPPTMSAFGNTLPPQPNQYGPPPQMAMSAPPQKSNPGPPPPKSNSRKSHRSKDVDTANELLTSIQKVPSYAREPSTSHPQQSYPNTTPAAPQPQQAQNPQLSSPLSIDEEPVQPFGDHQHMIDFLRQELARVTPSVPAEYSKQLADCNKRLNLLFGHLQRQELLTPPIIAKLNHLLDLMKEHKYSEALAVQTDIATNHAQEAGNWLTGVRRLINLAEAASN